MKETPVNKVVCSKCIGLCQDTLAFSRALQADPVASFCSVPRPINLVIFAKSASSILYMSTRKWLKSTFQC